MSSDTHFVGWLGKLPAVGDFASRGLEPALQDDINRWISQGMGAVSARDPDEWLHAYLVTPVWHFVINPGVWHQHALQGCVAPSVDKVGRYSPLLVLRSFDGGNLMGALPPASDWIYRADARLRQVIAERVPVDLVISSINDPFLFQQRLHVTDSTAGILDALGISLEQEAQTTSKRWFSWPDLKSLFEDRNHRSFWWAEPSSKQPPRQIIHAGQPDEELFVLLMGGALFAK